jgi:hypothetical protein
MAALTVLVLESDRDASAEAAAALTAAGHVVVRCHDDGAPAFPCNALREHHACPLRERTIDVALTVRGRPRSQPAPHEDGVACALERHVPVVVAGETVLNPFEDFGAVAAGGDIVAACEQAAARPLERHGRAATAALYAVLAERGETPSGHVEVHRSSGRLVATLIGGPSDRAVRGIAAVRIIAALRAVDRDAAGIDVVHD